MYIKLQVYLSVCHNMKYSISQELYTQETTNNKQPCTVCYSILLFCVFKQNRHNKSM